MRDALNGFPSQFLFEPIINNIEKLPRDRQLVICGMGGSHLSADIFNLLLPGRIRAIHMDYGLPVLNDADADKNLYVMSSYSGNTEEVMESYEEAKRRGYAMCAMAVGGRLIERAAADGIPYIQFPSVGIQPRAALGYGVVALAALVGEKSLLNDLAAQSVHLSPSRAAEQGARLAEELRGKTPIVYATNRNAAIAQNWKIKFCENTKIPAFWNVIPELNHNEMTGFDVVDSTRSLSEHYAVVMLSDTEDHPRNARRLEITRELFKARGIAVHTIEMAGSNRPEKIFSSLLLADFTSVALGEYYGVETEQVPMVEEFKNRIK